MKLWLLRPTEKAENEDGGRWDPWYDCTFGFVVRASTEEEARRFANDKAGQENDSYFRGRSKNTWLLPELTNCDELHSYGITGVIIEDLHCA